MKNPPISLRKHGARARAEARFVVRETHTRDAAPAVSRARTQLTFESNCQAYLWITDKGRARLIKH